MSIGFIYLTVTGNQFPPLTLQGEPGFGQVEALLVGAEGFYSVSDKESYRGENVNHAENEDFTGFARIYSVRGRCSG